MINPGWNKFHTNIIVELVCMWKIYNLTHEQTYFAHIWSYFDSNCSVPPPNDDRTRTSVFYIYWRTFLRVQHGELQDKTNTNKTLKHATKQSKVITKRSKA